MADDGDKLYTVVEEKGLLLLSKKLGQKWRDVGRFLDLSDDNIGFIQRNNSGDQEEMNYQILLKWKQSKGEDATWDVLAIALKNAERQDLADKIYKDKSTTAHLRGNVDASGYSRVSKGNVKDQIKRHRERFNTSADVTTDHQKHQASGSIMSHETDVFAEGTTSGKYPGTGFGQFEIELAESFTLNNARKVATLLEFPAANIDKIESNADPGQAFTQLLREKGVIGPNGISALIKAMERIGLRGVSSNVEQSFARNMSAKHTSTKISPELQGKKEQFLKEIIETYAEMYNGVQPIPYIRDRLMCVEKVFIDSGIEYLSKEGASNAESETWRTLGSYNAVFTDPRLLDAMVFILYGEPGYGKSTLALQYVYDWCNRRSESPLKDKEMLLFLRLRYLKEGMSFCKAIKEFLLPSDTTLSEGDIKDIIQSCTSVVIVFDGFDEYSQQGDISKDDVMKIIARQLFRGFQVVLTTRPSSTPPKLSYKTQRVRLTGFDNQARERYILKAVVDGNSEAATKILHRLQQNPVLADICQVPLFCVMFAHMTHEKDTSVIFDSVTSFFRYVMSCFYEHVQIKAGAHSIGTVTGMYATKHNKLDKVAFESLQEKNKNLVWRRDIFIELIGDTLYNELVEIGVLVEENVLRIVDDPGTSAADHIQRGTNVSFYHKLFCEWYAAHYVAEYVNSSGARNLQRFFEHMDPFDLQYVYRIACGLNPAAAEKIIQYLHSIEGGDKFAILCILEQTGKIDNIKETIRQLCDEGVVISGHDSLLLQRSSMQLLEIAAQNDIAIKIVDLQNCLRSVDLSSAAIRTTSGLVLTSKIPIKMLVISLYSKEMTEDEAIAILEFSAMCSSLRRLGYGGCVPPRVFKNKSTLSTLKSRNVKVSWRWAGDQPIYNLNLLTGRWENKNDGSEPTVEDFQRMLSKDAKDRKGWTEESYKQDVKLNREFLRKDAEERRRDTR